LGWTLDAFDFAVLLLIMHPIAQTFDVSMTAITFVFTITLWMRLTGATTSGWLGDRLDRKTPLMIAILGYSLVQLRRRLLANLSSCSLRAPSQACSWAPSGRLVVLWRWSTGRSVRAASWAGSCRVRGAWASCRRLQFTGCSTT